VRTSRCAGVLRGTCRALFGFWWVVLPVLVGFVQAGIILEPMRIPASEDAVWRLAARGAQRYAGGWLALDRVVSAPVAGLGYGVRVSALRLGTRSLGTLLWTDRFFGDPPAEGLAIIDRYYYGWALRVPVFPAGPLRLQRTEHMLLTPDQLRISFDGIESEVGAAKP